MGRGSGMTCWRRLRDWQQAGVWRRLHQVLLHELGSRDTIDWSLAALDYRPACRQKGGLGDRPESDGSRQTGLEAPCGGRPARPPTGGTAVGRQRPDSQRLEAVVDAIEPIRRPRGRPRNRPEKLHADKGYDCPRCRRALWRRETAGRIARRGIESSEKLGRHR